MGVSTDGLLFLGVLFDEDDEFPWHSDEFDYDWEDWLRKARIEAEKKERELREAELEKKAPSWTL
jgi:hypothetical protein